MTFAIGASALVLLYVLEARDPRAPGPLLIMAAGILAVSLFQLSEHFGVRIVGAMQTDLPALSLPQVNLDDVLDLPPGALAIVLFVVSETLGVGHSLGREYGYDIDPNQELIALGVAKITSTCLGGLVSGIDLSSTDMLLGLVAEAKKNKHRNPFCRASGSCALNVSMVWIIGPRRREPAFPDR